jgi:predicted RNA-binding protein with RPS1 domain
VSEFDDSQHAGKDGKIELVVGESYPMKIIKLAPAERKIGLSIRALKSDDSAPTGRRIRNRPATARRRSAITSETVGLGLRAGHSAAA